MNIVAGWTSRPEARAALERAFEEAQLRGAHLYVVRLLALEPSENPVKAQAWADKIAKARSEGEALVSRLAERGLEATHRVQPVDSDAATTLLDVAREVNAGLLVIGIRRRTPVGKFILGSVAQDVLLGADCPVLAVKHANDIR